MDILEIEPKDHSFELVHPLKIHITGQIKYNRGIVLGPRHPNGRNEDFILEIEPKDLSNGHS